MKNRREKKNFPSLSPRMSQAPVILGALNFETLSVPPGRISKNNTHTYIHTMNTEQMNRRGMQYNTSAALEALPPGAANAVLTGWINKLDIKLAEVDALAVQQSSPLYRSLIARNEACSEMVEATLRLAGLAFSHARANNLSTLAASVRVRPGDFRRTRYDRRVQTCQHIAASLRAELPQLAGSGITEALLDDLDAKVALAAEQILQPRNTIVAKRAATEGLVTVLREVDDILREGIDPLIYPLRKAHPDFYARYRAAREIVHRPASRASASETALPPAASLTTPAKPSQPAAA